MLTLIINCGPLSTTITETFGTASQVQWFDKNVGAQYQLPIFASSLAGCPITTQISSSTTGSIAAT
jgi:hypothetical protein